MFAQEEKKFAVDAFIWEFVRAHPRYWSGSSDSFHFREVIQSMIDLEYNDVLFRNKRAKQEDEMDEILCG